MSETMRKSFQLAFSLVEIVVAIGVVAFGLLTVVALLPLGLQSNKISAEETRASMILSMLEADLRNSLPARNGAPLIGAEAISKQFQLQLPYELDSAGKYRFNSALAAAPSTLSSSITKGLSDAEAPLPLSGATRLPYQVSVIYLNAPAAGELLALQARLIVNWPALPDANAPVSHLSDPSRVSGVLETLVTFPAP